MSKDKPEVYDREKTLRVMEKHGLKAKHFEAWLRKFYTLRGNAKLHGTECTLILSQYVRLAIRAGLTRPDQIGLKTDQHHMSRKGDKGGYTWGNCRFLTAAENLEEKYKNGGIEAHSKKMLGRTKQNDPGIKRAALKMSRTYVLKSPEGRIYKGVSLSEFARTHNLSIGNLSAVCRGRVAHCKGWTGTYK